MSGGNDPSRQPPRVPPRKGSPAPSQQGGKPVPAKPVRSGESAPPDVAPPNFLEMGRRAQARDAARPPAQETSRRPATAKAVPPQRNSALPAKRPSNPVQPPNEAATQAPRQPGQRPSGPAAKPVLRAAPPRVQQQEEQAPQKREPATIEELIPLVIRVAIKRDEGLTLAEFDEKLMPRVRALVPENLQRMEREIVNEYLVDIAHSIYVAIVVGQFSNRPVLSGVKASELAADLVERVLQHIKDNADKRVTSIRCANLLVGLTLNAVRLLESTDLNAQPVETFTDCYERAVITTYGLKTQAEASGAAPWLGQKNNPLDKRIGAAINVKCNAFGDYISSHMEQMDEALYEEVLRQFDGFMDRFAPYIEGGRSGAEERKKRFARNAGTAVKAEAKVEPLEIKELRTRPAGVEIALRDGRTLFLSTDDARRVGEAADAEVKDTARRERDELEARQNTPK